MADTFSKKERSKIMSRIGGKNTKPELKIRKGLHAMGFRFRIHDKNLPGKPDIKLTKYKAIIEVYGCFWHGHFCHGNRLPKSRIDYWKPKIEGNKERDKRNIEKLQELGWRVLVIWECSMRGKNSQPLKNVLEKAINWILSEEQFKEIQGSNN